jgi:hypothetical protein
MRVQLSLFLNRDNASLVESKGYELRFSLFGRIRPLTMIMILSPEPALREENTAFSGRKLS